LAVDVREAARLLSVSPRTIRRMLADARLRPVRVGRRLLVNVESLRRYAQGVKPAESEHGARAASGGEAQP